jgi:hypothetical protein
MVAMMAGREATRDEQAGEGPKMQQILLLLLWIVCDGMSRHYLELASNNTAPN